MDNTYNNINPQVGFVPVEEIVIDDLETLKVMADPLRLRIRELMYEPCTVKQVAAELDIPPTKLYYHINLLEKHGLIVLVDTRIVSGIIEKHYQVASRGVRVSRNLLSPTGTAQGAGLDVTFTGLFDDTRQDLRASIQAGVVKIEEDAPTHETLLAASNRLVLTADQAKELYEQLKKILREYNDISEAQMAQPGQTDLHVYKMFLSLFPSKRKFRLDATKEDEHKP